MWRNALGRGFVLLITAAALSGCSGNDSFPFSSFANLNNSAAAQNYSLGATIQGLNSTGLVLMVNATAVTIPMGPTTDVLAGSLAPGTSYTVTVQAQPTGETCQVADGAGTIQATNVTVAVTCTDEAFTVGGSISGLISAGLVLANGTDTLAVSPGASSFTMPTAVAYSGTYGVAVQTQPAGLTCTVGNGSGTMGSAAVTDIGVSCAPNAYTVGGSITGLTASGLTLLDNGGDTLTIDASATQFTMGTAIAYGSPYAITVQSVPAGSVCTVSDGAGTMGAGDVTNVGISCSPNFTLLHSFAGGSSDGKNPYHALILASDGNFYGTTLTGGASNGGVIFEISPGGNASVLYSFASTPYSQVIQGSDGNFYGTTAGGGTYGRGTIFKVTPGGSESVLYSFPSGGSDPYTGVIQGSDGNFYGTTGAGGSTDNGTVFEMTPAGVETQLYAFPKTGSGGNQPYAGLVQGSDGNFYGTTYFGGANGFGTVFRITPAGTETILYSFAGGSDGEDPYAGLIQGSDGNFYGTTYQGGAHNFGTIYRITPGGTETVLYAFSGGSSDGANPEAGVIQGSDGNLYGSTYNGGSGGLGTVFELTLVGAGAGTETILHSFAGGSSDGSNPSANLIQGGDGALYGSTYAGGTSNDGTFFKVTLQ